MAEEQVSFVAILMAYIMTFLYWVIVGLGITLGVRMALGICDLFAGSNLVAKFDLWRAQQQVERAAKVAETRAAAVQAPPATPPPA